MLQEHMAVIYVHLKETTKEEKHTSPFSSKVASPYTYSDI